MSRQVKRWIAMGVLAAILAVTFIQLGQWQLRRLDERKDRNAVVLAHEGLPIQPYQDVMTKEIGEDDQWYRVTAEGTYTGDQFQVRYRSLDGAYGSEVVAVMETTQGDRLLINRGFLTRQPGHPDGEMPPVLKGTVSVTGYVRRNDRGDENPMTPHENQVRLINSDALAKALGTPLVNGYVSVLESSPAESTTLVPLPTPNLDEGPHLSYAFQWFAFTVIGVVGMGILIRADLRDRRKAAAKAAAKAAESALAEMPEVPAEAAQEDKAE